MEKSNDGVLKSPFPRASATKYSKVVTTSMDMLGVECVAVGVMSYKAVGRNSPFQDAITAFPLVIYSPKRVNKCRPGGFHLIEYPS